MQIYDNVKDACKENGVTISELEEELGFSRGSIYKWNKHLPNVEKLKSVSKKLGKPMEYFLKDKGEQKEVISGGESTTPLNYR